MRMDMRLNREGIAYVVDRPPALVDYPLHVLPYTLSVPVLLAAAAGLVLAAMRLRGKLLPVWTFLATYALLLALDNSRLVRATMPLAALAAIFVGYLVYELGRRRLTRYAAVIGAAAVVGYAFLFSFAAVRPYAQTDPRVQAAIWLHH